MSRLSRLDPVFGLQIGAGVGRTCDEAAGLGRQAASSRSRRGPPRHNDMVLCCPARPCARHGPPRGAPRVPEPAEVGACVIPVVSEFGKQNNEK